MSGLFNGGINWKYLVVVIFLLLLVLAIVLPICLSPKTIDKGNGFKHQTGEFGECEIDSCQTASTHRIKARGVEKKYCEEHWESYGKDLFYRLSDERTKEDKEYLVKSYATSIVKKELVAPSTAKFCPFYEMTAVEKYGDIWLIHGYVDAENIFGAKIREYWIVELTLTRDYYENASVVFK